MKTLVINLERETARLAHMRRVFGEQGLDFEVVKAVDAKLLSPEQLKAGRTGKPRFYELGAGEIACFLSHRKCWEIAAKSEDAYTIVCEDDIFLGENAAAIFGDDGWIPEGAGVVRLEACRPRSLICNAPSAKIGERGVHALFRAHAGAGAYIISRKFAGKLTHDTHAFDDPVDQFLFNRERLLEPGCGVFQLVPAVAIQEYFLKPAASLELGSTLRGERREKRRSGIEKLRRELLRPIEQLIRTAWWAAGRLFSNRLWIRVPFR